MWRQRPKYGLRNTALLCKLFNRKIPTILISKAYLHFDRTPAGKLPQQKLGVAGDLKKLKAADWMQRRINNQLEQTTEALSGQQKNKTVTKVQLPQVNLHKKPENS